MASTSIAFNGITSLPPAVAAPARLLALKRGHWQIENALHYTKDVTLGEDRSLSHAGAGPTVMALVRDTALNLLRRAGHRAIARQLRAFTDHPLSALALALDPPTPARASPTPDKDRRLTPRPLAAILPLRGRDSFPQ